MSDPPLQPETADFPGLRGWNQPVPRHGGIRLLPADVSARIAAGEVVERPASVVKELVENALDAGARAIRVDVRGGGLAMIRVSDDGAGIEGDEIWLACQRHATSKLPLDDLAGVRTLGFRGEALPSIAAVAELTITSAVDGGGLGRTLTVRDGRLGGDGPAARTRGTTVTVRRLFERVPARLAAIERPQTEAQQIVHTARRLALAAPAVRLTLFVEERLALQTGGSGDLATAMAEVYGDGLTDGLHEIGPVVTGETRVAGVVAGPELTRPSRGQINLIVNGRWVHPRGLLAQIEQVYRPLLPRGRHPIMALVIEVPPDRVDVNIHPAKLDVRLRDERAIAAAAGDRLRELFGRRPLRLELSPVAEIAAIGRVPGIAPGIAEDRAGWDDPDEPIVTPHLPPLRLIGQVQNRLMLLEGEHGLVLVDQHRAHERVLFERLVAAYGPDGAESVALPEPLIVELRPAQVARFGRRLDELARLGFEWESFGGRAFLLRSSPRLPGLFATGTLNGLGEADQLVPALLALAGDDGADGTADGTADGETWRDRLLVQLSCRTAVRRGRPLDRPAMRALVALLGESGAPAVCPHGSPLLLHVAGETLEKQFGWR